MFKKNVFRIYQLLLFFIFLESLNAWFTWNIDNYISILYIIISAVTYIVNKDKFNLNRFFVPIVFFLLLNISVGVSISTYIRIVPIILFIALNDRLKYSTLNYITNLWIYILIPSLLVFIIAFFVKIPSFGVINHSASEVYSYQNHLILIKGAFYDIRFNSIFLEPGHLGMIIAFFLYALKFDFSKWQVWLLLIVEVFTLSLAGYLLVFIGYGLNLVASRKSVFKLVSISTFIAASVYLTGTFYNNGNNLINELIIQRLNYDEEKGIAGNNRFGEYTDNLVDKKYRTGAIWFGESKDKLSRDFLGAGWKVFFIKYGMISILITIMFYASFIFISKNKLYALMFFILIIIAFLQRSYPLWASWIIPFVASLAARDTTIKKYGTK